MFKLIRNIFYNNKYLINNNIKYFNKIYNQNSFFSKLYYNNLYKYNNILLFSSINNNNNNNIQNNNKIINGINIANDIKIEIKNRIESLYKLKNKKPGLAFLNIGDRIDSLSYLRMKRTACEEVGINSTFYNYDISVNEDVLIEKIKELNNNNNIHGILVQLPLPDHINKNTILKTIKPEKDVDGLHPENISRLILSRKKKDYPFHIACTGKGVIEILDRENIEIEGKEIVVLGRSILVGTPIALLLNKRDASVTVLHSKSKNIPSIVKRADIIISAVGQPKMIKGDWIKKGAIIIDVGINAIPDKNDKRGYRIVGDVDFDEAIKIAHSATPVPGGVGPMTISMLLTNVVNAFYNIEFNKI